MPTTALDRSNFLLHNSTRASHLMSHHIYNYNGGASTIDVRLFKKFGIVLFCTLCNVPYRALDPDTVDLGDPSIPAIRGSFKLRSGCFRRVGSD